MKARVLVAAIVVGFYSLPDVFAEGDPTRGAQFYRTCVACHALEPGLHLSGPSLGNIMGRQAGTAEGFVRYSPGMKAAHLVGTRPCSMPGSRIPGQ